MATQIVEQILVELGLDMSKFSTEAEKAFKKNKELSKSLSDTENASKKLGEESEKTAKRFNVFETTLLRATGLEKWVTDAADAADAAQSLAANLGISQTALNNWQNAAKNAGGDGKGIVNLFEKINELTVKQAATGKKNAILEGLGVELIGANGKARYLNKIVFDLSESLKKLNRPHAYALSKQLGLDDATANLMMQGSKGIQQLMAKPCNDLKSADAQLGKFIKSLQGGLKIFGAFTTALLGGTGLLKLADDASKANMHLLNLSSNLRIGTSNLVDWRNAAQAFGGSAEGMTTSLTSIKQAMNGLVMFGDASMLPYFNALGVAMVDSYGKVRQLDDVMLDLADAFHKMPRDQAYTIGKKMGFDDGTINALASGRKELQEILDIQKKMYHSDATALARSRELNKQQAVLSAHWQSTKKMIGDALTPVLLNLIKIVNGFFEFLQRHEKVVTNVFKGAALVIGLLLIPTLLSAARALLGFIAPFTPLIKIFGLLGAAISPVTLLVGGLAAAFGLLYNDYKTWSEGGESLFDWESFANGIKDSKVSVETLKTAFFNLCSTVANNAIPTLKGYAEILGKLVTGDFTGAADQAKRMIDNYSDIATGIIADALGEKKEDIGGFIGESMYRLTHGGKSYEEVNNVKPLDESRVSRPRQSGLAAAVTLGAGVLQAENGPAKAANGPTNKARAAAQYATVHAKSGSTGKCARFVNNALRAQGIKIWGHGKDVAGNLLKRGDFEQVAYNSNYVPQIGDVMSMPSSSKSNHNYGHVAIWNGYQWVSDFRQRARGNTAAPSDAYLADIRSGRIKPTIARMKSTGGASNATSGAATSTTPAAKVINPSNSKTTAKWSQTKDAFVKKYYSAAVAVSKGLNGAISPEGILAQWALETGWGTKVTPGTGYNLGNHKADIYWKGEKTKEKILDKRTGSRDHYRVYTENDLVRESIKFLSTDRYAKVRSAKNDQEAFQAMEAAGYAEGANYSKLIMQINNDIKAHVKAGVLAAQATQAQRMVAQSQQTQGSVVKNDNRKHVNVNIQAVNVNTSAKTVSGNVVAAVKGVNNYMINQLGTPMT